MVLPFYHLGRFNFLIDKLAGLWSLFWFLAPILPWLGVLSDKIGFIK
jgi:hypothetical protein